MPLALGLALSLAHARSLNEGGGVPVAPDGFQILTGADVAYLIGADGAPLYGVAA